MQHSQSLLVLLLTLIQGWTTSLVGGPYAGRRNPSLAGLLDGSSVISSQSRSEWKSKK